MCFLLDFLKPPSINVFYVATAGEVSGMLRSKFNMTVNMRDDYVWYVSENDWIEIIKGAHSTAPAYRAVTANQRGFDCDDFARHLRDYAACEYMIKGVWECWGYTSFGYHAWNLFLTPGGLFETEPQNAEIWLAGSNLDYTISLILA